MPVIKYEAGGVDSPSAPLLYQDGFKDGLPVITNRSIDKKEFIFDKEETPINDIIDYEATNKLTLKSFKTRWLANSIRNDKNYPDMGGYQSLAKYVGTLTNKPAILIGAGPSLSKNAKLLKDTDITTFATMHSLPFLEKIGVKPDFVVHSDAMSTDMEFITDFSKDITLIAISFVAPSVIRRWKGDISFFKSEVSDPFTDKLDTFTTADTVIRPLGCSMASAMTMVDELFDANTLIFIGNDLAYSDSGKSHVWDGLDYNTNEFAGVRTILVDDGKGKRYDTCYQFILYRNNIMRYSQNRRLHPPYRRYINATEGGMLLLPETMTLKKALKSVENTTYNVNAA